MNLIVTIFIAFYMFLCPVHGYGASLMDINDTTRSRNNAISFEMFGHGFLYSLNYSRKISFSEQNSFSIWTTIGASTQAKNRDLILPVLIEASIGKDHQICAGLGGAWWFTSSPRDHNGLTREEFFDLFNSQIPYIPRSLFSFNASIKYRYMMGSSRQWYLYLAYTPRYLYPDEYIDARWIHWGGLGIGLTF